MTAVYTVAQMRAWEDAAVTAGSSYATLMENAGARADFGRRSAVAARMKAARAGSIVKKAVLK